MTGQTAPLDGWLGEARRRVGAAELSATTEEIGRVGSVGDGVAIVAGLRDVRLNELVRFEQGQMGFVLTLDRDSVGCVLLDDAQGVEADQIVRRTGDVVRVPVGEAVLGHIVDPLGRPIDGGGAIEASALEAVDRPAPPIVARDFVSEPVQTGILVLDTMFAIGRGQRELIVGDRAIGKTAIAVDCMINQRNTDMVCVYVAVGQKSSSVSRVISAMREHGAWQRCIIVAAGAAAAPGLRWLAPFTGVTMAEYFRDRGKHALVVIDDLTQHAATHREIALLTHQPPGREAYPADVFHVHARLLERAAKLSRAAGGGSLTALPIAELDAGNLSAYIPTNLISITDGQIVLSSRLFQEGHKPAVDIGISVSRVGGKTQAPALRDVAEALRLDYAQFLELEIFTRFGGLSDVQVKRQIERGRRVREILAQPPYAPLRLADEVALVHGVQAGLLDRLPLDLLARLRADLPAWLDRLAAPLVARIESTGRLADADRTDLEGCLSALVSAVSPPAATRASV
jgi:F-type H+-transporting ATPase subunit alpha